MILWQWPLKWILQMVPTVWFPSCRLHSCKGGRGPRILCHLTVNGTRIQKNDSGELSIEVVDCENEHCRAAHRWANAQARHKWPVLFTTVRRLLRDEVWDVDVTSLPSRDECVAWLLHKGWVAHSVQVPIPFHRCVPSISPSPSSLSPCADIFNHTNGHDMWRHHEGITTSV